jgi:hypothetical protein
VFTEEILAANLAALESAQGQRLAVASLDPKCVRVVGTPNGPAIELFTSHGHWVPMEEPQTSVPPRQLFVIGAALGNRLEAALAVGGPTRVVVLEPDPGVAALLLARCHWQTSIESKRLRILVGPDYQGASTCARDVDISAEPEVIVSPQLAECRPTLVRAAEAVARRIISEARSNANARKRFAGPYLLQTLKNLDAIGREGDVAVLTGRLTSAPAVLVAAGPSLDQTLPELRELQERAVIIAADTALRPLLSAGVKPHLVVAVDPAETNAAHLAGVNGVEQTFFVSEASLHPSALLPFSGRTFFFRVSNHEPWPWLRTLGVDRGVLRAWGSVLTSAFDLALRMGCDPIVFTGADLAYSRGRPYCRGTIYEALWDEWHRRGSSWEEIWTLLTNSAGVTTMKDHRGDPVRTAPHLIAFRNWLLEQMAAMPGRRFINATGGGVLYGTNVSQMPLRAALPDRSVGQQARRQIAAACAPRTLVDLSKPRRALVDALQRGKADDLLARWVSFTADTVSAAQILLSLKKLPPERR